MNNANATLERLRAKNCKLPRIEPIKQSRRNLAVQKSNRTNDIINKLKKKNLIYPTIKNLIWYANLFDTENWKIRFTTHFVERANDDRNKPAIQLKEITDSFDLLKSRWDDVIRFEEGERFVLKRGKLNIVCVVTYEGEHLRLRGVSCIRRKNYLTELPILEV